VEGVLARGDARLAEVVEHAYRDGARFDSWSEHLKLDVWERAFAAAGIEPDAYLGTLPVNGRVPWDHIDVGLEPGFLAREYRRAVKNRLSPPCGKAAGAFVHHTNLEGAEADKRKLVCYDCGVACDLGEMRSERIAFLTALGAHRPRSAPTVLPQAIEPDPAGDGPGRTLRFWFEKVGRATYTSHLDLIRILTRLFRHGRLSLRYSQGFHPRPLLSLGPALPLGTSSLAEYVEVRIAGEAVDDPESLLAHMNEQAPTGLSFVTVSELGASDGPFGRRLDHAEYVLAVPRTWLRHEGLADDGAVATLFSERRKEPLVVERTVKGRTKTVDVGTFLECVEVGRGAAALARAGLHGDLLPVHLRLRVTATGTARPSEVVAVLFRRTDVPVRVVRTALTSVADGDSADSAGEPALRGSLARTAATTVGATP
jgi:radical SAM-linked protein